MLENIQGIAREKMMPILKEMWEWHHLLGGPRPFGKRQPYSSKQFVVRLIRLQQFGDYWRRRQMARHLPESPLRIEPDLGWLNASEFDTAAIDAAMRECKEILAKSDLEAAIAAEKPNMRQFGSVHLRDILAPDSPIMKLILHPVMVSTIADYIGMLPILSNARIWYSPNNEVVPGSSQMFHMDTQDLNFILVTLHLRDVDEESGPLVAIAAKHSVRFARRTRYRMSAATQRIPDEVIMAGIDPKNDMLTAVGPAGSLYMCDTDRCFHYGSRKGSKPRLVLAMQYCTPSCFNLPVNWWDTLPFARMAKDPRLTKMERMVLGARE